MDKSRMVNTKFWSDKYIEELTPFGKLLYLYLFTNERTNICGVYEITPRIMSFDTGIGREEVEEILEKLEGDGKIIFQGNHIFLKNFIKHQNLKNGSIRKSIENNIPSFPLEIAKALRVVYDSCTSGVPVGTKEKEKEKEKVKRKESKSNLNTHCVRKNNFETLQSILMKFKPLSPSLSESDEQELDACDKLIVQYGVYEAMKIADTAIAIQGKPYAPKILKPSQLWEKVGDVAVFLKRNEVDQQNKQRKIISV